MKQFRKLEKVGTEMDKFFKFWFGCIALGSVLTIVGVGYVVIKVTPALVHYLESK